MSLNILSGDKVYLAPIEKEHLEERVNWINDLTIQNTLNYPTPVSLGGMKKWYDKVISETARKDFSVFTKKDNIYIGFCGLLNIETPVMKAELYAVVGDKNYWGGGFGTEIYSLLMEFGFKEVGLNKIYGYQLIHNKSAHRVVEKLGWKRDGLLREDIFSHGEIKDRYVVSILRKDWLNR